MKKAMNAYARNPHVLRKLVRFRGFVPANIIEKEKKAVTPVEISQENQEELLEAGNGNKTIDIAFEGNQYRAKVAKIFMDEANKDIDEIELAIVP